MVSQDENGHQIIDLTSLEDERDTIVEDDVPVKQEKNISVKREDVMIEEEVVEELDVPDHHKMQYFTCTLNLFYDKDRSLEVLETFKQNIEISFQKSKLSYFVGELEIAPTTGMYHIQFYCEARSGLQWTIVTFRRSPLFKNIPIGEGGLSLKVLKSRGTAEQNRVYCLKDKALTLWFYEKGKFRNIGQGKDGKYLDLQKKLDAAVPLRQIAKGDFTTYLRHYRAIDRYIEVTRPGARPEPPKVLFIHGASGSGKSSLIKHYFPEHPNPDDVYWLTASQKSGGIVYWDGYTGQKIVIIDEYHGGFFGPGSIRFLKLFFDKDPCTVPVHGSSAQCVASLVIFISNYDVKECFDTSKFDNFPWGYSNPMYRRIFDARNPWKIMEIGPLPDQRGVAGALADLQGIQWNNQVSQLRELQRCRYRGLDQRQEASEFLQDLVTTKYPGITTGEAEEEAQTIAVLEGIAAGTAPPIVRQGTPPKDKDEASDVVISLSFE